MVLKWNSHFCVFFPHVVLKPLRLRHTPGRQSDSTGAACGLDAQILGFTVLYTWFYMVLHGFIVLISFDTRYVLIPCTSGEPW